MSASPGLRGVVALESSVSAIIDDGLTYRGIPVDELVAQASFEEVSYLLWFGRLPAPVELDAFVSDLQQASRAGEAGGAIGAYAGAASPLQMMQAAALWLGSREDRPLDDLRQGCEILATLPAAIAQWSDPERPLPESRETGGISRQLLESLLGRPALEAESRAFERSLILIADHELNASTFAARVAASTLTDAYQSVLAALATLSGPLHGGAPVRSGQLLASFDSPDVAAREVVARFQSGERITGFGHSVYTQGDPRARLLRDIVAELASQTGNDRYLATADSVVDAMSQVSDLQPNVDFYDAACWLTLGLAPELFPALFAFGRLSGWIAHILEQHENNRLIRPRARYTGAAGQHYLPLSER